MPWHRSSPSAGACSGRRGRRPSRPSTCRTCSLFHGGGGNTTDSNRRTLTLNYTRGWLRTQFNQYLSIPRETVLALPAELQTDLGYHRSVTGLGSCEAEDPLKYLGKLIEAGGDGAQTEIGLESRFPPQAEA